MRIMLVGHGRCGKDTSGEYLASVTGLRFAGTTSKYLAKYVARQLGRDEADVYQTRHADRDTWHRIGKQVRASNPGVLIRESLADGQIIGGVRDHEEIVYAKSVVDLIIWVDNNRVPIDQTVEFTSRECDVVIQNHWSLDELHHRLDRLAKSLNIFRG